MHVVTNSSPLIFLARLELLEKTLQSLGSIILPKSVADEIAVKQDDSSVAVKHH